MNRDHPIDPHFTDEATPLDATVDVAPVAGFGLHDSNWSESQWQDLIISFVENGLVNWKELGALILGHLNPSQTGTSLASSDGFKRRYGKGNTMRIVMDWAYAQTGQCQDCGSRLELQADHIESRELFTDPLEADYIENITLRCRRCNVVRRPSHEQGGKTFLTAESALMWILLVIKPRTYFDFVRLCRIYGMTMADIRMQEAWAMAHWLSRNDPPLYGIENDENASYDLLHWQTGEITRTDACETIPDNAKKLYENVRGNYSFAFLAKAEDGRIKLFNYPLRWIPFSTYDLGEMPPYALAIRYTPPNKKKGLAQRITPLPPSGDLIIVSHVVVAPNEHLVVGNVNHGDKTTIKDPVNLNGKLLDRKLQKQHDLQLSVASGEGY
ncbi:HNH endonuclease [Thiomicrospira cyclica]|uniref:HNH domain-containing protein n=1 Tax=Thiomicrospira cyclica (strain DSM 14477 / JCM 11371 / ALM1) TaxID=717773 RepID=F6DCN7_THICA|nr:HNH endonuclease [Thiomicrospira cyclica]AEG31623.1 hypothetical protein Thicy_0851 [Thiomicrospira cyclica ALM1]